MVLQSPRGLSKASGDLPRHQDSPDGILRRQQDDDDRGISPPATTRDEELATALPGGRRHLLDCGNGGTIRRQRTPPRSYREDGKWWVCGTSGGSDCSGEAIACRFGKGVDRTRLRLSEVEWHPKEGPLKLLDVKDGFCALTEMFGPLDDANQEVRLSVKEGALVARRGRRAPRQRDGYASCEFR